MSTTPETPETAETAETPESPESPESHEIVDLVEIVTTWPAGSVERHVAGLVADRLIACAQCADVRSMYRWQGAVEQEGEVRAHLHTTVSRAREVTRRIAAEHPYDVPCILVVPVVDALPEYARWVAQEAGAAR